MSDLELVDTAAMIEELKRRHTSLVVIGMNEKKGDPGNHVLLSTYSGGLFTAIGMCHSMIDELMKLRRLDDQ